MKAINVCTSNKAFTQLFITLSTKSKHHKFSFTEKQLYLQMLILGLCKQAVGS